jgi:hypothetical protein
MHITKWRSPGKNFLNTCFEFKANGIRKRIMKDLSSKYRGDFIFMYNDSMKSLAFISNYYYTKNASSFLIDSVKFSISFQF